MGPAFAHWGSSDLNFTVNRIKKGWKNLGFYKDHHLKGTEVYWSRRSLCTVHATAEQSSKRHSQKTLPKTHGLFVLSTDPLLFRLGASPMDLAQEEHSPQTLSCPPVPLCSGKGAQVSSCVKLAQWNRQHMASHNQPHDLILSDCYFYSLLLIRIN